MSIRSVKQKILDKMDLPPVALSCKEDLSDKYWLRTYAGMAMQSIIAQGTLERCPEDIDASVGDVIANRAVGFATALLKAVKAEEGKNGRVRIS